jgi:4-hydroxy-4-methyl-2-oxoglutarate aldolase
LIPPSTAVADVLALRGHGGWLSPPLKVAFPGTASGAARTVSLQPGTGGFGLLYELLSSDLAGRVLVVDTPDDDVAVWGALLGTAAANAGAAAVVVGGAVRDVGGLALPTWARTVATVGPAGALEVAAIGNAAEIGGVAVADGDAVVVDDDGVVCLHAATAEAVLADARAYAEAEDKVAVDLLAGTPLRDAYRHKADVVARLKA